IRGFDVEQLAGAHTFEDALGLLWDGSVPAPTRRESIRAELAQARVAAFERINTLGDALRLTDGMDALRASMAHLVSTGDVARDRMALAGAVAVYAAAWARIRAGAQPVAPDATLRHAAD